MEAKAEDHAVEALTEQTRKLSASAEDDTTIHRRRLNTGGELKVMPRGDAGSEMDYDDASETAAASGGGGDVKKKKAAQHNNTVGSRLKALEDMAIATGVKEERRTIHVAL